MNIELARSRCIHLLNALEAHSRETARLESMALDLDKPLVAIAKERASLATIPDDASSDFLEDRRLRRAHLDHQHGVAERKRAAHQAVLNEHARGAPGLAGAIESARADLLAAATAALVDDINAATKIIRARLAKFYGGAELLRHGGHHKLVSELPQLPALDTACTPENAEIQAELAAWSRRIAEMTDPVAQHVQVAAE